MLAAGCDFNPGADRTNCEGFVENLRTLPDTTLVVDSEPFTQDLEGIEPFFRHTARRDLAYLGTSTGIATTFVNIQGENATTLVVEPGNPGISRVTVRAVESRCMLSADFAFTVEVVAAN